MNYLNHHRVMSHLFSQVTSAHTMLVFPRASFVSCLACSEKWWRDCSRFRPGVLAVTMLCIAWWSPASARRDKARQSGVSRHYSKAVVLSLFLSSVDTPHISDR